MKKIMMITGATLLIYLSAQVCGCGGSCDAKTNAIENSIVVEKTKTVKLKITGMTCAGCSNHISNALKEVDGIIEYNVEYPGDLATIQYDPQKTNPDAIIKLIKHTGYKAEIVKENQKEKSL